MIYVNIVVINAIDQPLIGVVVFLRLNLEIESLEFLDSLQEKGKVNLPTTIPQSNHRSCRLGTQLGMADRNLSSQAFKHTLIVLFQFFDMIRHRCSRKSNSVVKYWC